MVTDIITTVDDSVAVAGKWIQLYKCYARFTDQVLPAMRTRYEVTVANISDSFLITDEFRSALKQDPGAMRTLVERVFRIFSPHQLPRLQLTEPHSSGPDPRVLPEEAQTGVDLAT